MIFWILFSKYFVSAVPLGDELVPLPPLPTLAGPFPVTDRSQVQQLGGLIIPFPTLSGPFPAAGGSQSFKGSLIPLPTLSESSLVAGGSQDQLPNTDQQR